MNDHPDDDELGRMLTASAPRTTEVTAAVEDELARMSVASRTENRPSRRRGLAPKVAAGVIAGVIVLGGAGAAAATTGGWWTSMWAGAPDAVYRYSLPSGVQCEARYGNITAATAHTAVAEAARQWYATADFDAIVAAGVDDQIAAQRADRDRWHQSDDGTLLPAWYGTELYPSPDLEYDQAVQAVINQAMVDDLERQGFGPEFFDEDPSLRTSGEINCPGAQW